MKLSRRALNRATLERQLLLGRRELSVPAALEHLVGLQAQAPEPPYFGLWSRVAGFRADELSGRIEDRRVVRIALMRSTIHLVTARDALALRPLMQPVTDRALKGSYRRHLEGLDLDAVTAAGRALLDERPRTAAELGKLLAERWPDRPPNVLANLVRAREPLVQVPPRGLWGRSGPAAHTTAESWLGRQRVPAADLEDTLLRYLAAFGPASVADATKWSGLTGLREVFERLRPRLLTVEGDDGRELFDLPDAPRPDPDTPAPVRFLAPFDNLLLSHADRTRVLPDEHAPRVMKGGMILGAVLIDGFVAGKWRVARGRSRRGSSDGGAAVLEVELFQRLAAPERAGVNEEGARLLAFAAADCPDREVRIRSARAVAG